MTVKQVAVMVFLHQLDVVYRTADGFWLLIYLSRIAVLPIFLYLIYKVGILGRYGSYGTGDGGKGCKNDRPW
jgi:hypothetical protein